jgi:hypothetical protein
LQITQNKHCSHALYRIGVRSRLFFIASDKYFTYLTSYRCQGHRTDLDGNLSKLPRTRNFTEEIIELHTLGELWDEFSIVSDVVVWISSFFSSTTHF